MKDKPSSNQFYDCIQAYLKTCLAKGYSHHTASLKEHHLLQFMSWCKQESLSDLNNVMLDELEEFLLYLRFGYRTRESKPLSVSTIRLKLTSVKVFLRWLYARSIISHNDCEKFELPRVGRTLPKPVFSYSDVIQVFHQVPVNTIKGVRDRAIMEFFYATGVRRSELTQLNIDDVDLIKRQVRVDKGKGAKDRYVPFGEQAKIWLRKYLRDSRSQLADIGSGKALFLSNDGRRFKPSYLSDLMSRYIRMANINKTGSCHQYRHAAATHMVDNDADIRHVQEFLGHASISTTQIYVHVSRAKLTRVYQKTHPRAK